ncbi:gliding motility lipoprotein GldD [Wenyingzhuangia sp. IMCC45533]
MKTIHIILLVLIVSSCSTKSTTPKPNAFLKLEYPKVAYFTIKDDIPYSFERSELSEFVHKKNGWSNLFYPSLNAEISITYQPIANNLTQLIKDAEKLTYKHTLKADNIDVYPFENSTNKVYARLFTLTGDVASPIQFQVTDSVKNFIYGSLYFNTRPNYDSILPAINYINNDIKHLIETLEWKN